MRFLLCAIALLSYSVPALALGPNKPLNPDISFNFLGLAQTGTALSRDRATVPRQGIRLQEAEIQAFADVDAYFRAVALFSVKQESGDTGYGFDPEEVYAETLSLPRLTLRAGKFKMALGKHNQLHTHAFPFIDAPLIHQRLLGDEGLNETGLSAAVLLPASWYSEVILQGFTSGNEALSPGRNSGDLGALARLKNLWDLNEDLTLELGISGAAQNNAFGKKSSVLGSDLTFKWRPQVGGKYHAWIWSTEYLLGHRPGLTSAATGESQGTLGGIASWAQYQFAERWWAQARYEYLGAPRSVGFTRVRKESALLAFLPSEFSAVRLQGDLIQDRERPENDWAVALQVNFTLGAHPAHTY